MTVTRAGDPFPDDFRDLFDALHRAGVEFLVVGAYALARHGYVRATLDLDVFVRPTATNAERVVAALADFGAPLAAHGVGVEDFARPGTVYQLGLPPRRIDVLTEISGVTFEEAWLSRIAAEVDGVPLAVLGRAELIRNKRASDRPKDRLDVEQLERLARDADDKPAAES